MLIAAAPVAIPVTTANPPTEAVAREAAQKTPIPEPASTTDSSNIKNSTDANEQPKTINEQTRQRAGERGEDGEQAADQQQQEQQQDLQEQREIAELERTDRSVRAHEQAHANVGGQLAGAPQYTFATGPDGKRYAVAGEVSIDTSKVANDPQATIDKMLQVQRAALAPAEPSAQDLKVAAIASQIANQARVELNLQRNQEAKLSSFESSTDALRKENDSSRAKIFFANPVAARRASLALNQRIVDSGALDNSQNEQQISLNA